MIPGATPPLSSPMLAMLEGLDFSIASTTDDFLRDSLERKTYLLIAEPWDSFAQQTRTLYVSNDGYASEPSDTLPDGMPLANQLFRARLAAGGLYNVETRVMSGFQLTGGGVPSFGQTQVIIADDDPEIMPFLGYQWRDALLRYFYGLPSWSLSEFLAGPRGVAAGISHDTMLLNIEWGDLAQRLRRDIQPRLYAGMGACLSGDGSDDRIEWGDVFDLTGDFTLRFRIWLNSATNSSTRCFNKDDGATGWLSYVSNQNLGWQVRGGAAAVATSSSPLQVGKWNDCWYAYDATADELLIAVFDDDEEEDIVAETLAYATSPAGNAHNLRFGASAGGANALNARWDELAIAPGVALDLATIRALRSRELKGTESGFATGDVWHLNDGTGTVAFGVNGTNGTITGAAWIGSLTGGPSLADKCRLRVWGRFSEWEPVCIDEQNGVYEINYGEIEDITALKHRGLEAYTYMGDVANVYSVTPASGEWYSCFARGHFRLNAVVTGTLTVSGKGSKGASYVEDPASLVKMIVQDEAGFVANDLDIVAFATIAGEYPYPVWIGTRLDPIPIWDVISALMQDNLQGWVVVREDARLSVGVLDEPGTPKYRLTEEDVRMDGIRLIAKSNPSKQTRLGYARYGSTQGPNDLSSSITSQDTRTDYGLEYRTFSTPIDTSITAGSSEAAITERNTSIAVSADIAIEAARTQAFWAKTRRSYLVPLVEGFHRYAVDDDVDLLMPITGLDLPMRGTIVAVAQNVPEDISLEVVCALYFIGIETDDGLLLITDDGIPLAMDYE